MFVSQLCPKDNIKEKESNTESLTHTWSTEEVKLWLKLQWQLFTAHGMVVFYSQALQDTKASKYKFQWHLSEMYERMNTL